MGINKLIFATLFAVPLLFSCGGSPKPEASDSEETEPTVSLEEYNQLRNKYELLREKSDGVKVENERVQQELNDIMIELNTISGRTIKLQQDKESGKARDTRQTAAHISESIAVIKRRLNAVSTNHADKQTLALVDNLRKTIALNEQEITRLNGIVEEKNQQISTLDAELERKNADLSQAIAKLRAAEQESWMHMGDELTGTADLLPDVKGHGNMKDIKQAKLTILQRAKAAYNQAYQLGCSEAVAKIQMVDEKYQRAYNR